MPEIDTPDAPVETGQPAEPTPEQDTRVGWTDDEPEPTPEPIPEPVPEPVPEPRLSPADIMEQASERAFQKMASWQGRRDKDLFDNLGNMIDSRFKGQQQPPQAPSTDPATMLENPDAWARTVVPRILDEVVQTRSRAEQEFNSELIRQAAAQMDNDPLFQDKNLGNAVVSEIQRNFGSIDKKLPPGVAAQLLVNNALASVVRQSRQKQNPLSGNAPQKGPMGTIKPPVAAQAKPKPVKLSDEAAALVKRWNYSPEDVARVFGEQ